MSSQGGNSAELLAAKSWELATSPAKQIPMQAIMLYMSGNTVQIFSMLSIGMLFKASLTGVASTEQGTLISLSHHRPCDAGDVG